MALTPLLAALVRPTGPTRNASAFGLGWITGAVYFAGTLYWLVETMTTFGGLAWPIAVFAAALLVAYLSLFPAAFAMAVFQLQKSIGVRGALLSAAPVWMASELGRQYVWDGFPWALLGYSQVSVLPVAQLASVTGVYGLSGLLVLTSAAAALLMLERGRSRWTPAILAALLVAAIGLWGSRRIADGSIASAGDRVRVAVIQGNIQQDDKWNPALRDAIVGRYVAMTRDAIGRGATFIIWPESSLPVYFEEDGQRANVIRRLAMDARVTLLIGSDQRVLPQDRVLTSEEDVDSYNAAFLVLPTGATGGVYRKMHLVPFGEYVPLQRLLFFVQPIVEAVSSFKPGADHTLFPVAGHKASTAICYEVIFGSEIRRFVNAGSELLTTITNDAWYGRSSAPYQHWDQAAMRAIENGRYLARAANTGVSGFVDPYGRVLQRSPVFEQAALVQDIAFVRHRTIYSHGGDLIAWVSLAFTAAALLASRRVRVQ